MWLIVNIISLKNKGISFAIQEVKSWWLPFKLCAIHWISIYTSCDILVEIKLSLKHEHTCELVVPASQPEMIVAEIEPIFAIESMELNCHFSNVIIIDLLSCYENDAFVVRNCRNKLRVSVYRYAS